jgi:hypothetical protein
MNKTVSIVMLVLSILCCGCLALVGVGTVIPKGFVDFPCFAFYDEANRCVDLGGAPSDEALQDARLQVFLTGHWVDAAGGACYSESVASDRIHLEPSALTLDFELRGEELLVNGEPLAAGGTFSFTDVWPINPWVIETVEFTNYGPVPICGSDVPARVVVIGTYGNELSLLKGGLVTLPVLALVIVFAVLVARARKKKV